MLNDLLLKMDPELAKYYNLVTAKEASEIFGATPAEQQEYIDEVAGYCGVEMIGIFIN